MKKLIIILLLLMLCSCSFSNNSDKKLLKNSSEVKVIKLTTTQNTNEDIQAVVNVFAKKVLQLTSGKIEVVIAPNENMKINSTEQYDIVFANNRQVSDVSSDFKLFNLPFMFKSEQHLSLVLNSERIKNYLNYELTSKYKVKVIGCVSESSKLVVSKEKPYNYTDITSPKFAINENSSNETEWLMTHLDFNAKKMSIYDINRGWSINEIKLFEVDNNNYDKYSINDGDYYLIDFNANPEIYWFITTDEFMQKLSDKEKAILTEAFAYTAAYQEDSNLKKQKQIYNYFDQRAIEFLNNSNIYMWDELHKKQIEPKIKADYNYELYNIIYSAIPQK